ncbi:uncharacterized protein (DUF1800 family) [Tahibacter aquaticus]|uniref:Uncharacterized protein (DUF1800 family) n=1 Tax=Tahibacter aquaticus TaxID=520092 RepID=A0A4R6YQ51_9GAMM|nr:DUF1800 family protein [Tahibacter aquaticus]TDR40009.1 uncharacterized protein (DUF1800 family) [Tahibacter aquaticus]
MSRLTSRRGALLACAALCVFAFPAAQARTFLKNGFDPPADRPATDAEAARFLTQATFGPTTAEIAKVRAMGYSAWIDQQMNQVAMTAARPHMEAVSAAMVAAGGTDTIGQNQRMSRWFHSAVTAPDQLRQRAAYALSQIFVIADTNGSISGEPIQMSEYWDLLARNAFGMYRTLLDEVSYNPSMGKFLSHFRNRKAATGREPDENYAREVMQLFSIGLYERNLDGSPLLSSGQPVPTYDQNTISNYAKVFTGFAYNNAGTNLFGGTNTYLPMSCVATEHDVTAKVVVGNTTIPAGQSCANDVRDGLNLLASHANVGPFIARQLIQRFTTSNPSPAYITRVAQKFNNNGDSERGDLAAVIKQVLLDTEARNNTPPATFGKVREPLLRLTAVLRAWPFQLPAATAYGEIRMGMTNPTGAYAQRPLGAATVFNFYEPDYQHPGPLADANQFAPEMQIINEGTTYSISNSLADYTFRYYVGMTNPPTDRPLIDVTALAALATPAAMVEDVNQRMFYGAMSSNTRTTLTNMLSFMNGATPSEKARSLLQIAAMSPEFATQR